MESIGGDSVDLPYEKQTFSRSGSHMKQLQELLLLSVIHPAVKRYRFEVSALAGD